MVDVMTLYLDDSGTRYPDKKPGTRPAHGFDWFALGGVIIRDSDREHVEKQHRELCERWSITEPLHSVEIRAPKDNFAWLGTVDGELRRRFLGELGTLATSPYLTATACVMDRPGYNARYEQRYGMKRWMLCKTAFGIVVERAAKFARSEGCRLRVYVERSDKKTDARLKSYYSELKLQGMPFNERTSSRYEPLEPQELSGLLYEFKTKKKTSRLMQLADICLWPICLGGYRPENFAYVKMKEAGVLLDCKIPAGEIAARGIKYSCMVTQKPG